MEKIDTVKHVNLIVPPQKGLLEGLSSGIISIASYLKRHANGNVGIEIHDLSHFSLNAMSSYLKRVFCSQADTVFAGITTTTATYQSAVDLAREIKAIHKNTVVIFGGHHAQVQDEIILKRHPEVDLIVRGEGEIPMLRLVREYPKLQAVPGLSYRKGDQIRSNPCPPFLSQEELDQIDVTLKANGIQSPLGKFDHITYVSARGCPLKCSFCAVANERIRSKSIQAIIRDLKHLVLERGYRKVAIENNFFAQSPKHTMELCKAIVQARQEEPAFVFSWDCQTRVESLVSQELVAVMRDAGCDAVYLGVENFDPSIVRYLGKSQHPARYLELADRAIDLLCNHGIDCFINLQVGFPFESKTHKRNNIGALQKLARLAYSKGGRLVIFPMLAVVYPGTVHFNDLIQSGVPESIFEIYTAWEERHQDMRDFLANNFAHGTGGIPTGMLDMGALKFLQVCLLDERIFWATNYLNDLRHVPHATVFDYSPYLVKTNRMTLIHEYGPILSSFAF